MRDFCHLPALMANMHFGAIDFYSRIDSMNLVDGLNALSELDEIPRCLEYMKIPFPSIAVAVERMTKKANKGALLPNHLMLLVA